jgi:hypothetical protein
MQNYETKLVDSSRMIADILTADISNDQARFDEMFELAMRNVYPLSIRAARICEMCISLHKHLILSRLNDLIDIIENSKIEGVRRSFLKVLAGNPFILSEELQGRLVDLAFGYISDNKEAIASRSYSIDIILKLLKKYPELKSELIYTFEEMTRDASIGLRTKSKKLLKQLK